MKRSYIKNLGRSLKTVLWGMIFGITLGLAGCKAEVGSERWCKNLKQDLDENLTLDGSKQYAKHCLFK